MDLNGRIRNMIVDMVSQDSSLKKFSINRNTLFPIKQKRVDDGNLPFCQEIKTRSLVSYLWYGIRIRNGDVTYFIIFSISSLLK